VLLIPRGYASIRSQLNARGAAAIVARAGLASHTMR
jgi:hypothetical protein